MSGILNVAARVGGKVTLAQVSSGALTRLYRPLIFMDDGVELSRFLIDNNYGGTKESPRLSPWYKGLLVIDFDRKRVMGCQVARDIACLSMDFDHSWMYFSEWRSNGWLGDGIVAPATGELVAKFPPGSDDSVLSWYEEQIKSHLGPRERAADGELILSNARLERFATAPRFSIRPPEWEFISFAPADCLQLRARLIADGFDVDDGDEDVWTAWGMEQA